MLFIIKNKNKQEEEDYEINKVFVLVSVKDLHINESYQRPVRSHVRTIAEEWDDMKCDFLKINYREDGYFYVWDG